MKKRGDVIPKKVKKSKWKMPKMNKKFNGKPYELCASGSMSKSEANRLKKDIKSDGFKVRVTKSKYGYDVWRG